MEIDDTTIKDVRNLFRVKKEIDDTTVKGIINLLRLKKENKAIKNYYKPARVGHFWNIYYIEYESNSDRNKTLSVEKYLNKVRPYLEGIINNLKKSDT